jgi:hypothetical protein
VASLAEYETIVARCGGWSVEDLGDLLHEIDRDRELDERDRTALQTRLYRLIWERAQPLLRGERAATDGRDDAPRSPGGEPPGDERRG